MKKNYFAPEFEQVELNTKDIINTSEDIPSIEGGTGNNELGQ